MWGWLHDNNVKLPLRAKWPPGVEPVGTLAPTLPPAKSVSGETDPMLSGDKATAGKKAPEKEEVSVSLRRNMTFMGSDGWDSLTIHQAARATVCSCGVTGVEGLGGGE